MTSKSHLEEKLKSGRFTVTCEVGPPKGSDPEKILEKASLVSGYADAYNITDNQTAVVRLSSIAGSVLLLLKDLEPIMQMTCRDRNRIALQSDLLGAASLGIRNVLCLTGDHQSFGNHPQAKGVFDIDSIQLLTIFKKMRDEGIFASGDAIRSGKPDVFLGAAANPFSQPYEARIDRLAKKIDAGAEFIQTQSVYDVSFFSQWLDDIHAQGLDSNVYILAGITPLKSVKMAERMKFYVPGVHIPDEIYDRICNASDPKQEGYRIAVEMINELKTLHGVQGIHITALFWEEIIPKLVKETGIL